MADVTAGWRQLRGRRKDERLQNRENEDYLVKG